MPFVSLFVFTRSVNADGTTYAQTVTIAASDLARAENLRDHSLQAAAATGDPMAGAYGLGADWLAEEVPLDSEKVVSMVITR